MTTENFELAQSIYNIEHACTEKKSEWLSDNINEWQITESVKLRKSTDKLSWCLIKRFPEQARLFCKIVPASELSIQSIGTILGAQPWSCI